MIVDLKFIILFVFFLFVIGKLARSRSRGTLILISNLIILEKKNLKEKNYVNNGLSLPIVKRKMGKFGNLLPILGFVKNILIQNL